jgi:radical SAM protein with 4Fe4S-binding SPASM domain
MADPLAPQLPREIQVEVTGACNLQCAMCLVSYRPRIGRREGAMCFHTFRALVDELPRLEKVTLQGLGEPLLAPDLERMVAYATERGAKVGFNTNGMLLTRERAHRLVAGGLSWLHVSLDGATATTYESIRDGADFGRVCTNVRGLVEIRRELGAVEPTISLVFVAMRRNIDELPALVRLAHDLGVDRLFVQNLSHSFSDTDPAGSYADIRRFAHAEALWQGDDAVARQRLEEAKAVAAELGFKLRLPRMEAQPEEAALARGCDWPFTSVYVTHRGQVQPCCMVMGADRAVLGDLAEQPFAAIWNDAPYRAFREGLVDGPPPEVCRGCSLYRGVF